jgi:hypothetical protein
MGLVTALAAAASIASIYGGIQAKKEGDKQADLATNQAASRATEINRQTARSTTLEERDIKSTIERQKLAYLASGVTLEGSPLLMMEETRRRGAENVEEIQLAGAAGASAQLEEGRATAQAAKASGRAQLMSGITGAMGSASRMIK